MNSQKQTFHSLKYSKSIRVTNYYNSFPSAIGKIKIVINLISETVNNLLLLIRPLAMHIEKKFNPYYTQIYPNCFENSVDHNRKPANQDPSCFPTALTLCIWETPKQVLLQAVKTETKYCIMWHFIRVYTVY